MTYRNIVADFAQIGISEDAYLGEADIINEVNKLLRKRGLPSSFNQEIHKQIWDQCSKNSDDQVHISQYIKTIVDAKDILEDRINQTQAKLSEKSEEHKILDRECQLAKGSGDDRKARELTDRIGRLDQEIYDLQEDFKDYDSDLKNLLQPFLKEQVSYKQSSIAVSPLIDQSYQPSNRMDTSLRTHSQIFFRRSSKTLMLLLLLTLSLLFVELLLMTHKFHFLSILCALALVAIFGLNYFDRLYIKFVILLLMLSLITDFIWLVVKAGSLWSPGDFSEDSRLNTPWYRLLIFLLIGEMFLKLVIGFILVSYRNNKEVQSINLCGYTVALSGDPSNNLITLCLENAFRS